MDILNFISWLKASKQVKSLPDSSKALLPLGYKDGRRDDSFQPITMTVEDLSGSLAKPIDIQYADLYNATVSGNLTPNAWYRLTDYRSVNYIHGWNVASNMPEYRETHISEPEVLLLQAISNNAISTIGYSEKFPNDVIHYNPLVNALGGRVNPYPGDLLPNGSICPPIEFQWDGTHVYIDLPEDYPVLFGHYFYIYAGFEDADSNYYAQDGVFEPVKPGYNKSNFSYTSSLPQFNYLKPTSDIEVVNDGKRILFLDLTQEDITNSLNDIELEYAYALDEAYGCIIRRHDKENNINVPLDFRNITYRRYFEDWSTTSKPFLGSGYYATVFGNGGVVDTEDYIDVLSIGNTGGDVNHVYIDGVGGPGGPWYTSSYENNVFYGNVISVNIGAAVTTCTFNNIYRSNVGTQIYNTVIKSGNDFDIASQFCSSNFIVSLQYVKISCVYFMSNYINFFTNSEVYTYMSGNIISSTISNIRSYGSFSTNTIDYLANSTLYNFGLNTFTGFQGCIMPNNFSNNIGSIGQYFTYNYFRYDADVQNVDFSTATHVYQQYGCDIIRRSVDFIKQLSYLDDTNTVVYTDITA